MDKKNKVLYPPLKLPMIVKPNPYTEKKKKKEKRKKFGGYLLNNEEYE